MTEHSRQDSREHRLLDTFNRAVHLSDPLISMVYMQKRMKEHKPLINEDIEIELQQFYV